MSCKQIIQKLSPTSCQAAILYIGQDKQDMALGCKQKIYFSSLFRMACILMSTNKPSNSF